MAGIAHYTVIAVASFGKFRIAAAGGIAVVAANGSGQGLSIDPQRLRELSERIRFVQIAGLYQRVVINRSRARQPQAVALHGQRIANQIAGRIFLLALHGAGEMVVGVRFIHETHGALVNGNDAGLGAIGDEVRETLFAAIRMT